MLKFNEQLTIETKEKNMQSKLISMATPMLNYDESKDDARESADNC